jgi:hypothetical protein
VSHEGGGEARDKVVARRIDEAEILTKQRSPALVDKQRRIEVRAEQFVRSNDRGHQRQCCGGHNPSYSICVEVAEISSDVATRLTKQQLGDHEATDDKEDVDSDVAALETGDGRVHHNDEDDRNRSHTLNVWSEGRGPTFGYARYRREQIPLLQ